MSDNGKVGFPTFGGFPATSGFPAQKGFPAAGFPAVGGFPSSGFPAVTADAADDAEDYDEMDNTPEEMEQTTQDNGPKEGTAPRNVKYYEGVNKLNKTSTNRAWQEFGGDRLAAFENDGSAYIIRTIERASKKTGVYFKLTERLSKDVEGYGVIAWRIELGAVVRRKPAKQKFDEAWGGAILAKVRAVVADGVGVAAASRQLADELGVSFSTMRANLWVADKWSRGETTTFLPHRSMIRPIFELMCELGKRDETLTSMVAYSKAVRKPSEYVVEILRENGLM